MSSRLNGGVLENEVVGDDLPLIFKVNILSFYLGLVPIIIIFCFLKFMDFQ